MVLGPSSSALLLPILRKYNWCLMKSCLLLKVRALESMRENINFFVLLMSPFLSQQNESHVVELWDDVYGNFIVQKLLEFGTDNMKETLAKRLLSEIIMLSTRVYGWWVWRRYRGGDCQPWNISRTKRFFYMLLLHALQHYFTSRVIQKAFDELSNRDVASLISAFKGNVLLCLNDHNGKILRFTKAYAGKYADNQSIAIHQATTSFKRPSPSCSAWRKKRERRKRVIFVRCF